MLKIKNGRLQVAGIEFSMPDGFFIDVEGIETVNENGLKFISPPDYCSVTIMATERIFDSAMDSLLDVFGEADELKNMDIHEFNKKETGYKWLIVPEIRECNGLKYACVKYEGPKCCYFEMHFECVDGCDRQLEILLSVPKQKGEIETILKKSEIKNFFEGIEKVK